MEHFAFCTLLFVCSCRNTREADVARLLFYWFSPSSCLWSKHRVTVFFHLFSSFFSLLALGLLANLRICKQTKSEQNLCSHSLELVKMTSILLWPLHLHLFFTSNPVTAVLTVPNFDGAPVTRKEHHFSLKRRSLTRRAKIHLSFFIFVFLPSLLLICYLPTVP